LSNQSPSAEWVFWLAKKSKFSVGKQNYCRFLEKAGGANGWGQLRRALSLQIGGRTIKIQSPPLGVPAKRQSLLQVGEGERRDAADSAAALNDAYLGDNAVAVESSASGAATA
jgi:hypothetical protein